MGATKCALTGGWIIPVLSWGFQGQCNCFWKREILVIVCSFIYPLFYYEIEEKKKKKERKKDIILVKRFFFSFFFFNEKDVLI